MKLVFPAAFISAVTNLMLKHGSGDGATLVPATALKLKGQVDPKMLNELREGLRDKFFDDNKPAVPTIPELAALGWKTEYEGGTLALGLGDTEDLDFDDESLVLMGVDAKDIIFEPLATGMCDLEVNAIVQADTETRGKLTSLARHTVKATFSKLTQKPLAEPKKPSDDAADDRQRPLTADGEAIVPLLKH